MKKFTKKTLLVAAMSLLSPIGVAQGAGLVSCYHVIEGACRAEENNDHVGFIALGFENCMYSIDIQYKFYDYLRTTNESPTLCRAGDVSREEIHEYRRSFSFENAQAAFQELTNRCMESGNGYVSCVTIESLDLDQGTGNVRVLTKNP